MRGFGAELYENGYHARGSWTTQLGWLVFSNAPEQGGC